MAKKSLNITVTDIAYKKLSELAEKDHRSMSSMVEVLAYDRWDKEYGKSISGKQ